VISSTYKKQKKKNFDTNFIKSFCPASFDRFEFIPSIGASGGSNII
jgi:hypothetical protein